MAFSVVTNVNSLIAQENLRVNSDFQSRTIQRLTSGYRINASGDDAAGLAVANKYRSEIAELSQGVRNANDGTSALQIIDGGLNNISKMLDRLKTLATQSASAAFTGNRTTLNEEYQALLLEIDRQAANVGLSTGAHGGRYNARFAIYVGGGDAVQANSQVEIDLSSSSNRVDAAGLGINSTSIAGGGATAVTAGKDLASAEGLLATSATQQFTFNIAKAGQPAYTFVATVTGDADGLSGAEAVSQLNAALSSHGITASIRSADGFLQFGGDVAFTVSVADASVAGTGLTTGADTVANGAMYRATTEAAAAFGDLSGGTETLTFTAESQSASVTLAEDTTMAQALVQLNSALNPLGIFAVTNAAGNNIEFQSASVFSVTSGGTAEAGGVFATNGAENVTIPVTSDTAITAALEAINKLTNAVSTLGSVQGKVGTAQNKLQYAIQLAQAQIANFSAAESRIRDADVAAEAANLTKAQVMQQASLAAMAQANSAPQAVLALLRG